jgi:hypothetical protein
VAAARLSVPIRLIMSLIRTDHERKVQHLREGRKGKGHEIHQHAYITI